jgi:hypothetical protein
MGARWDQLMEKTRGKKSGAIDPLNTAKFQHNFGKICKQYFWQLMLLMLI